MCQFPDLKDLLSEMYHGAADIEFAEFSRFLPETTQRLYTILDNRDVISSLFIKALTPNHAKDLLGELYTSLVDGAHLWPNSRVEVIATITAFENNRGKYDIPGITVCFKPNDEANFQEGYKLNFVMSPGWQRTWLAVSHDKFPMPDDMSTNHPMLLLDADALRDVVHPHIPKEHRAYVVAKLATRYGWSDSIYAGNQVCLIK